MNSPAIDGRVVGFMQDEAESLLEAAKRYREQMNAMPEGDSRRAVLWDVILFLLSRSRAMSAQVTRICALP